MQYFKVTDINDADYWIPTFDPRFRKFDAIKGFFIDSRVTLGKPYEIYRSTFDGTFIIFDNSGFDFDFVGHHGYLVKNKYNFRKEIDD